MNDYKAKIEAILGGLKLTTDQLTKPPYTEDNKPTGIISISGKEEATASLLQLLTEARISELETMLVKYSVDADRGADLESMVPSAFIINRLAELKEAQDE